MKPDDVFETDADTFRVRGKDMVFGFETRWGRTAPEKCICGTKKNPHWCEGRADKRQQFFRSLKLTGDFYGEPFVPLDWVDDCIDVTWGMMVHDGKGWYRLIQEVDGHIIRGGMKSIFQSAVACYWLATARRGRTGAFAQQTMKKRCLSWCLLS